MVWKTHLLVIVIACSDIHGLLANTLSHEDTDDKALETNIELDDGEDGITDAGIIGSSPVMEKESLSDTVEDEMIHKIQVEDPHNIEEASDLYVEDILDSTEKSIGLSTSQGQADSCSRLESGGTKSTRATFVTDGTVHITKAPDCTSLYEAGIRQSGIYQLHIEDPGSRRPLTPQVYCELSDSDIDGGGWTYIQSRVDDSVDFYRYWDEYEDGFGDATGNFWVGLKAMHELTSKQQTTELMVHLETFIGTSRYAHYTNFFVGDSSTNYRIKIGEYTGTAGNSLEIHNNMMFTTRDRDNDQSPNNCANHEHKKGGWWYNLCSWANLNGVYYPETYTEDNHGIHWRTYRDSYVTPRFKHVSMKIRRN